MTELWVERAKGRGAIEGVELEGRGNRGKGWK